MLHLNTRKADDVKKYRRRRLLSIEAEVASRIVQETPHDNAHVLYCFICRSSTCLIIVCARLDSLVALAC